MTTTTVSQEHAAPLRVEFTVHFARERAGRKVLKVGPPPQHAERIPRVARLLALAHHFDRLIADGVANDYADIARLAHLTRARVSQIMALRYLAPDIQEQIALFSADYEENLISEKCVRIVALEPNWEAQRSLWLNTTIRSG
ncbi:MAG: hypothetical protein BWY76_02430 [bacterium ADurb.Bin429]|nr:MAG: hypothetical protein BWY76_02430 [bacterium ADurb.Bin429]